MIENAVMKKMADDGELVALLGRYPLDKLDPASPRVPAIFQNVLPEDVDDVYPHIIFGFEELDGGIVHYLRREVILDFDVYDYKERASDDTTVRLILRRLEYIFDQQMLEDDDFDAARCFIESTRVTVGKTGTEIIEGMKLGEARFSVPCYRKHLVRELTDVG